MKELLDKQVVLDAIYDKMETIDKPDVILGLMAAMGVVKDLEPVKEAEVLDEIRSEIVHLHDWAFSREEILRIIDKYKASPTGAEGERGMTDELKQREYERGYKAGYDRGFDDGLEKGISMTEPIIEIDGKRYKAEALKLKTIHGKTGEVVIGGFKEVQDADSD